MVTTIALILLAAGTALLLFSQSPRGPWAFVSLAHPGLRGWLSRLLACPAPADPVAGHRGNLAALGGGALVGAWLFAYKLRSFYGLGTTSDMYSDAQLATSWMGGRFLWENCFGYQLSTHTYLFAPILALLVWPMGAPGLLVALSLAAAASFAAGFKILRLLDVPAAAAWGFSALLSAMPLSAHVYEDSIYGFHFELLAPAMALWMAYFALRRNWAGTLLTALATISVKEDATLVVGVVCGMVICEDAVRSIGAREKPAGVVNWPAVSAAICAAAALPALLLVIRMHPATGYSPGGFERIKPVGSFEPGDMYSIINYASVNFQAFAASAQVAGWWKIALPATLGLAILRPHYLPLGVGFSAVAWLMRDDPFWAPRFYGSFAFFQVLALLAFSSACASIRWAAQRGAAGRFAAYALSAVIAAGIFLGFHGQAQAAPDARLVYALRPHCAYSPDDRARADALFAVYRRDGLPGEPVIAAPYLFRYAHDRNLFWYGRLGETVPVWILWDGPFPGDVASYDLLGQNGRFYLYRKK